MKIEIVEQCPSCKGSGIYRGMGEGDGYGVQCYTCKGTGKHYFSHEYVEFTERVILPNIFKVLEVNPGIKVGGRELDFGGVDYIDWLKGNPFPAGSEMRKFTCPAWWYQSADYNKKPDWKECIGCGSFSGCKHFVTKNECWKRFDQEKND